MPWLPPSGWPLLLIPTLGDGVPLPADVVDVNRVGANGGRLIIDPVLPLCVPPPPPLTRLLFKWFVRRSKFSLSRAACCNLSSLIADISSSFCVSSDERDNISWKAAPYNRESQSSRVNNRGRARSWTRSRTSTPVAIFYKIKWLLAMQN